MIPIYKGRRRQKGYGIGGNFASFFRSPLLKDTGITIGKEFLNAGSDILDDVSKGSKNWKGILKKRGKKAALNVIDPLINHAKEKIKDIFSEEDAIPPPTKRRKASKEDEDIFSE